MVNYSPQNPPRNLSVNQFRAAADNAGQFAKQCRFVVRINGAGSAINDLIKIGRAHV